jgi:hypothetical protein
MSLAGTRLLARRCPACRWREPGLPLLHGTWEGGADTGAPVMVRGAERKSGSGRNRLAVEYRCGIRWRTGP